MPFAPCRHTHRSTTSGARAWLSRLRLWPPQPGCACAPQGGQGMGRRGGLVSFP